MIEAVDTGTGAYVAAILFQVSFSYIYKALILLAAEDWRRSDRAPVLAAVRNQSWRRTMMPFVHALRPSPTSRSRMNCRLGYIAERKVDVEARRKVLCGTGSSFLKLPLKKSAELADEPPSRIAQDVAQARDEYGVRARANLNPERLGFHRRDWRSDRHGASL